MHSPLSLDMRALIKYDSDGRWHRGEAIYRNGAVVGERSKRDNINVSHPSPITPTKALRPGIWRRPGVCEEPHTKRPQGQTPHQGSICMPLGVGGWDGPVRAAPLLAREVRSMAELTPPALDDWPRCRSCCLGPKGHSFLFPEFQRGDRTSSNQLAMSPARRHEADEAAI